MDFPRRVDFDEAIELSDLMLIEEDLKYVCDACDRLLDTDEDDYVLCRSLFVAAIIAYARCFKGNEGVRLGLDEDVLEGMGETNVLTLHRWFVALRNKHIAHSVNPFDEADVGVTGSGALTVVRAQARQMIGVPHKTIKELKKMAAFLIRVVSKNEDAVSQKVIAAYQALTMDQVRSLPPMEPKPYSSSEVTQAREGLKRRQRRGGGQS